MRNEEWKRENCRIKDVQYYVNNKGFYHTLMYDKNYNMDFNNRSSNYIYIICNKVNSKDIIDGVELPYRITTIGTKYNNNVISL